MTEYVVLIVGDADRWWTTMDAEQRAAGYAEYTRFGEELARRGHTVTGGAELHATSEAKRIAPGGGVVTDGPFAETREQLGGYYLIDASDLDEAIDIAGRIPGARVGTVEIRPLMQLDGLPAGESSSANG